MSRNTPNRDLTEALERGWLIAKNVTHALEHIARELSYADSYPTSTPGASIEGLGLRRVLADCVGAGNPDLAVAPCPGCDICEPMQYTPTERAAFARHRLTSNSAQIRVDITSLSTLLTSLAKVCDKTLGIRIPIDVPRCDGRTFAGSDVPWVPHSRDPDNGWYDPTCIEAADASGLSPRCRVRERRWREEHGLAPREHNASVAAA